MSAADTLRDFAGYLARETKRRADGKHPGVVRLRDDEIAALLKLIRPQTEVGGGAHG